METIDAAAIRFNGFVYTMPRPNRHYAILKNWPEVLSPKARYDAARLGVVHSAREEQGFITSTGRFVDRREAAKIALDAGQIPYLKWPPNLYTEALW